MRRGSWVWRLSTRLSARTLLGGLACARSRRCAVPCTCTGAEVGHAAIVLAAGRPEAVDSSLRTPTVWSLTARRRRRVWPSLPAGVPRTDDTVVSGGDGTRFQVARFGLQGTSTRSFGGGITDALFGGASAVTVIPPECRAWRRGRRRLSHSIDLWRRPVPDTVVAEYLSTGSLTRAFGSGGVVRRRARPKAAGSMALPMTTPATSMLPPAWLSAQPTPSRRSRWRRRDGHLELDVAQVAGKSQSPATTVGSGRPMRRPSHPSSRPHRRRIAW